VSATKDQTSYLETLEVIATDVIRLAAAEIDQNSSFPRAAVDALSQSGLLGLISAGDVGGRVRDYARLCWLSSVWPVNVAPPPWSCVCIMLLRRSLKHMDNNPFEKPSRLVTISAL
jgi:alkylation response protein AidB-like acyl-CoA dehydrogenase